MTPDDTPPALLAGGTRTIRAGVSRAQRWHQRRRRARRAGALFLAAVVLGGLALLSGWWR